MKIKNWIKYIIFHRYLSPKYRQHCMPSIKMQIVVTVPATAAPYSSSSASSSLLIYCGIDFEMVKLGVSLEKSSLSTNTLASRNSKIISSA